MDSFNLAEKLNKVIKKTSVKLPHGVVSDEYLVDINFYNKKKWDMINFDEYEINPLIIDLFVQALQNYKIKSIETFLINSNENIKFFKSIEVEYNKIADIFYNNIAKDKSWKNIDIMTSTIVICDKNINFIVIINAYRENHYFFGGKIFKNKIFPASNEAKKDFLSGYCERYEDLPLYIDYLNWLYENYLEDKINC